MNQNNPQTIWNWNRKTARILFQIGKQLNTTEHCRSNIVAVNPLGGDSFSDQRIFESLIRIQVE